jgi:hypothetical protein
MKETQEPIEQLAQHVRIYGAIPTVRVSSTRSRTRTYWSATRYEIVLRPRDGWPIARALESAEKDRRSRRMAEEDARVLASRTGRMVCQAAGPVDAATAEAVLQWIACQTWPTPHQDIRSRVTLDDAASAGYCHAGIVQWARMVGIRARRLSQGIPAGILLRRYGDDPRVRCVVTVALRRLEAEAQKMSS